jgi:hypothetical protein
MVRSHMLVQINIMAFWDSLIVRADTIYRISKPNVKMASACVGAYNSFYVNIIAMQKRTTNLANQFLKHHSLSPIPFDSLHS